MRRGHVRRLNVADLIDLTLTAETVKYILYIEVYYVHMSAVLHPFLANTF